MPEAILGISCFYHDSAAALIKDGEILGAAQEERFTRIKHDPAFPTNAVEYCLQKGGLKSEDLKAVVFYDKPWAKFERILENYFAVAPRGISSYIQSIPLWLKEKLWMRKIIDTSLGNYEGELLFCRHHESHGASAFYPSPFEDAAVLTMDGVGEWHTTTWGEGRGNQFQLRQKIDYPHSLGLLYSAITYYTGFKVNSGEYKVMGLAPYGEPKYVQKMLDEIIDLKDDGSFRLNMKYFSYHNGLRMTNNHFAELFGGPARQSESDISQKEMDLARSVQEVVNMALLNLGKHIRKESGLNKLCLAGGVALNCVANGILKSANIFDDVWIQPASGDAGGALGAALFAWHQLYDKERTIPEDGQDLQNGSRLGPSYTSAEIDRDLKSYEAVAHQMEDDDLYNKVAEEITAGKVIGWFQGKMEFGPRALGGRSIIGDPRSTDMQATMNLKIKYRESFRPFAPSVLKEFAEECFEMEGDSPYMLLVHPVKEDRRLEMSEEQNKLFGIEKLNIQRSDLPAITHVDYSARVQTVDKKVSPEYYNMIDRFRSKSNCPLVINTSFNVRGEPIVCTPQDAYRCFMRTEMDVLVIDNHILFKEEQPDWKDDSKWKEEFALD
ncbi:MAG: carbamoyltransferase [Planctomycetes bacterium]|nr:carbamoyltransferase [Planctomycetota bacterium]